MADGARLMRAWGFPNLGRVELHLTPDVVAFAPHGGCDALLYGANELLSGPLFTPSEANARLEGNSVRGNGIIYPEQCVDGQVTEAGGLELRRILSALPMHGSPPVRCAWGSAVRTIAPGVLRQNFRELLHACPPPFACSSSPPLAAAEPRALLLGCYLRAFDLAWRTDSRGGLPALATVAASLLGAGARGFSLNRAADVLADAVGSWRPPRCEGAEGAAARVLCVGVQDEEVAEAVGSWLDRRARRNGHGTSRHGHEASL
ncbi:hypothetical protein KFE25_008503 [Diacronema lutheri]|uniref:Uncharacterized protein n=1 Tax=Diacronema lutheri TaxID=2081491 RepID=A0A8J5XWR6_DIALT|nr:hypothetical protein KFE25_008503 [Diacronema lutheri]